MRIELGPLKIQISIWSFLALSWGMAGVAWAWVFIEMARRGYPPPWAAVPGRPSSLAPEPLAATQPQDAPNSSANGEDWI